MAHFDWCVYKVSKTKAKIDVEAEEFIVATQEGEINLEEVLDDYLVLKHEEKTASEIIEKYVEEKISETLADAPIDDPMHHSWDRYLELANHGLT